MAKFLYFMGLNSKFIRNISKTNVILTRNTIGATRMLSTNVDKFIEKCKKEAIGISSNNPLSPVALFDSQQKEINLDDLHSEWWDPLGNLRGLHSMNHLRVPLIRDGLISTGVVKEENRSTSHVLKDINILEVGCGGGILTEALARLNANVTGIDLGENLICAAKLHAAKDPQISPRLKYFAETIEHHLHENRGKYDAVVASEVLEHVDDQCKFLTDCVEALKPGGSIFVTTLNKTPVAWFGGIFMAENVLKLLPKNTHSYEKFISPDDVEKILHNLGCNTVLLNGMKYEFWWNHWSWTRFTDINYAMHAVKLN